MMRLTSQQIGKVAKVIAERPREAASIGVGVCVGYLAQDTIVIFLKQASRFVTRMMIGVAEKAALTAWIEANAIWLAPLTGGLSGVLSVITIGCVVRQIYKLINRRSQGTTAPPVTPTPSSIAATTEEDDEYDDEEAVPESFCIGSQPVRTLQEAVELMSHNFIMQAENLLRALSIPRTWICPLAKKMFADPVTVYPGGKTYERSALEKHEQECKDKGVPFTDPQNPNIVILGYESCELIVESMKSMLSNICNGYSWIVKKVRKYIADSEEVIECRDSAQADTPTSSTPTQSATTTYTPIVTPTAAPTSSTPNPADTPPTAPPAATTPPTSTPTVAPSLAAAP